MNNKNILLIVGVVLIGAVWLYMQNTKTGDDVVPVPAGSTEQVAPEAEMTVEEQRTAMVEGEYSVDTVKSIVNWAGQKPLIDGYVNSGTLALSSGDISVSSTSASGTFMIDMNTLKVGLTAAKPNQEATLEDHLKGDRWFNVEGFPTASFVITSVVPSTTNVEKFAFDITGDLTMKGETHPVTLPAIIYMNTAGELVAEAATEINRTTWGITAGSGSFFDNLADNVIDDMISLSFYLVATK